METIYPTKLQPGDTIQVIAPATSMAIISEELREYSRKIFEDTLGLKVIFGKHIEEIDDFNSSSIESRVSDLHEAFSNPKVKAIFTIIGGFNSNQLLRYIDWELIKSNPKIFCGYSDITVLSNAIYAKTGLVTYSGPHYSTFGQKMLDDYNLEYLKKCLFSEEAFEVKPSLEWSNDRWFRDQDNRNRISNEGYWVINEGEAEGTIIGGNLCSINLLQGTEYMPAITDSILFIEDDNWSESPKVDFNRDLQSLIHLPSFSYVKGIMIGRFQKESDITREILIKIIKSKKELEHIPVIANVDFGHTDPMFTFPVGGTTKVETKSQNVKIKIFNH
jgi:muramoyltetrapeptide carboxypeptidase